MLASWWNSYPGTPLLVVLCFPHVCACSCDECVLLCIGGTCWHVLPWMHACSAQNRCFVQTHLCSELVAPTPHSAALPSASLILANNDLWKIHVHDAVKLFGSSSLYAGIGSLIHFHFLFSGVTTVMTFDQWGSLIKKNFEPCFWVPPAHQPVHHDDLHPEMINRRLIYKDSYGAIWPWADYQLRPNFPIAMVVVCCYCHHSWCRLC